MSGTAILFWTLTLDFIQQLLNSYGLFYGRIELEGELRYVPDAQLTANFHADTPTLPVEILP
ncbi:MAG: hypothetical protein HY851_05915, partial [candidate division Zixibacteria bacterium]|nr:hypothetical protein [candidate division Zixibacteria bacterium]